MNPLLPAPGQNPLVGGATPPQAPPQGAAPPAGAMARPAPQAAPGPPGSQMLNASRQAIQAMNLSPEEAAQKAQGSELLTHLLAPMARGKAPVSIKTVAKAAAEMVSSGYMSASDAVQFLTKLPTDHAELKGRVEQLFKGSILASINLRQPGPPPGMTPPGAITQPPVPGSVPAAAMPPGAPPAPGG